MRTQYKLRAGKPLSAAELAGVLGVSRDTIDGLRRKGELTPVGQFVTGIGKPEYQFEATEVDKFLAEHSNGFALPPTLVGIASGNTKLVGNQQAATLLAQSQRQVVARVKSGALASIRFARAQGSHYMICLDSIEALKSKAAQRQWYSTAEVLKVLGGGNLDTAKKLVASGELVLMGQSRGGAGLRYTCESVHRVVAVRLGLPNDQSQDWIEDALDDPRTLMLRPAVESALGIGRHKLTGLMNEGGLRYIIRHNTPYFLPMSIDAYRQSHQPVTLDWLAAVLASARISVHRWTTSGILQCPLQHDCDGLRQDCVVAIVKKGLHSSSMTALEWCDYALEENPQIFKLEPAAKIFGCDRSALLTRIKRGTVTALLLPTNNWRVIAR